MKPRPQTVNLAGSSSMGPLDSTNADLAESTTRVRASETLHGASFLTPFPPRALQAICDGRS